MPPEIEATTWLATNPPQPDGGKAGKGNLEADLALARQEKIIPLFIKPEVRPGHVQCALDARSDAIRYRHSRTAARARLFNGRPIRPDAVARTS